VIAPSCEIASNHDPTKEARQCVAFIRQYLGLEGFALRVQPRPRPNDLFSHFNNDLAPPDDRVTVGRDFAAIAYGELGEMAKARECLRRLDQRHGGRTPENILLAEPFADTAVQERLVSALRRAIYP
jgi:hypothetical protein